MELFQRTVTSCAHNLDSRVRIKLESSIKEAAMYDLFLKSILILNIKRKAEAIAETIEYCDNPIIIQLNWSQDLLNIQRDELKEGFKGLVQKKKDY